MWPWQLDLWPAASAPVSRPLFLAAHFFASPPFPPSKQPGIPPVSLATFVPTTHSQPQKPPPLAPLLRADLRAVPCNQGQAVKSKYLFKTSIFCADTGGSCRVPASFNGVAGLRPTKGCYANDDLIVPLSSTRDTPGEITPPGQGNSTGCLF